MYTRKQNGWMEHMDFRLLDLLCLQAAFWLACLVRHGSMDICFTRLYLDINMMLLFISFVLGIMLPTFSSIFQRGYYQGFLATLRHVVWCMAGITLVLVMTQTGQVFSRIILVLIFGFYFVFTYWTRIMWKRMRIKRNKVNKGKRSILLMTSSDVIESVIKNFMEESSNGYTIAGIVITDKNEIGEEYNGLCVVATEDTVVEYVCRKWVDEIFIYDTDITRWKQEIADSFMEMGITVHVRFAGLNKIGESQQFIDTVGGYPVLTSTLSLATPVQSVIKRTIDILGGIVGCMVTGVLTLIIGPVIKIKSPGPIFFKQVRIGRHGKKFQIYKFRSMYMDAEERKKELMEQNDIKDGMMFKMENDPRIIGSEKGPGKGIGNFIRKYSIDEFPQFLNVLKGDMSLVGTRPPTEDEWKKYALHHHARLAIKPGLTGMWQVSGRSDIKDFEEVVKLDKEYIVNWSMGLDARILFKTFVVVFGKKGSR